MTEQCGNRTLLTPFAYPFGQVKFIVMNNSECDKQFDFLSHRFTYRMAYYGIPELSAQYASAFLLGPLLPSERERVSLRDLCTIHNANPVYANIIAAELVWQRARSRAPLNLHRGLQRRTLPREDPFAFHEFRSVYDC